MASLEQTGKPGVFSIQARLSLYSSCGLINPSSNLIAFSRCSSSRVRWEVSPGTMARIPPWLFVNVINVSILHRSIISVSRRHGSFARILVCFPIIVRFVDDSFAQAQVCFPIMVRSSTTDLCDFDYFLDFASLYMGRSLCEYGCGTLLPYCMAWA
jgi:hypothetical protein